MCEADSQLLVFTKDTKIIERATSSSGKLKIGKKNLCLTSLPMYPKCYQSGMFACR
jgi:hypothetical protein